MLDRPQFSENQLQRACVELLQLRAVQGVVWCHVPNELMRSKSETFHQIKMGAFPGWPDLQIFKGGFCHFVEFKVGHANMTEQQWLVRVKLERQAMPYAVIRKPEAFEAKMAEWGIFK